MYRIGNSQIIIERGEISDNRLRLIYDKLNQLYEDERFYMKNKRCQECIHSVGIYPTSEELICNYILDVGVPRGCPVGDECDKFEPKKKSNRRVDANGIYIGESKYKGE